MSKSLQLTISSSVFFLFSSSTIAPSDQFWFHSNPAFTLLPNSVRRLSFTRLCSRSLAFTVSSHRALRYDLAVSCFLLTVLRHKMLLLRLPSDGSTTLCVRRFFSPPRYPTTHDVRSLLVVVFALAFDFFSFMLLLYLNSSFGCLISSLIAHTTRVACRRHC